MCRGGVRRTISIFVLSEAGRLAVVALCFGLTEGQLRRIAILGLGLLRTTGSGLLRTTGSLQQWELLWWAIGKAGDSGHPARRLAGVATVRDFGISFNFSALVMPYEMDRGYLVTDTI